MKKLLLIVMLLPLNAWAFDANIYARAGIGIQAYTGENGGLCLEYTIKEQAKDSNGDDITMSITKNSGYVGYGDAGIWMTPGAKIYFLAGYSYIGCTQSGDEYHGPMLGLQAGEDSYISIRAMYVSNLKQEKTDKEKTEIAYQPGIGIKIGGLSIDVFAFVYQESLTGVVGATLNF